MKPIIKNKVAFFHPQGFIDGENAVDILTPLEEDQLAQIKPEGIFISLKKVIFFNKRGLSIIVEAMNRVKEKNGAIVGFCDYDIKKYDMILEMFKDDLAFSLFETLEIVLLYIGDDLKNPKEKDIIVYNEKSEQKNQLAMELYERGFTPVVAKDGAEFLTKRKEADFVIENSYLGSLDKTPTVFIKDNVIVYTLKNFVDSNIAKTFDMTYHHNSLRVGFKVFLFDCTEVSSINVHGVEFITKLSVSAAEFGASLVVCGLNQRNITEKLTHDLEDAGIVIYGGMKDFFQDEEFLKEAQSSTSVAKTSSGITKKLIESLPTIAEATLKTIETLSGYDVSRKSLNLQNLAPTNSEKAIGTSIGFYGELNGILVLVFEKEIAKKTCEILLEEDSNEGELLDALGEFVHIVGGKISQQLHKKGTKIDITMPRTFETLQDALSSQFSAKGAQLDMDIDGKPLSMFLTK